jgi:hypothetical protein
MQSFLLLGIVVVAAVLLLGAIVAVAVVLATRERRKE